MILITINDKEYKVKEFASVRDALDLVDGLPKSGIAVALNNDALPI